MAEDKKEKKEKNVQPEETVPVEQKEKNVPGQKISVEIDYEKLADAIVKAQEKSKERLPEQVKTDEKLNKLAMAFSYGLSIAEFLFCVLILVAMVLAGEKMQWTDVYNAIGNVVAMLLYVLIMGVIGIVAYWTGSIAKKIKTEPDRNYTVAVFSSLAAFAGFAVAGISLLLTAGRG